MVKMLRVSVAVASLAWVSALGMAVVRGLHPALAPGWVVAGLLVMLSVATVATVSGMILYALPTAQQAWRDGVDFGRDVERSMRPIVPEQSPGRRHLTPV